MMLKKILSVLLCIAFILSVVPLVSAQGASGEKTVYISSKGSDNGQGTKDAPYRTLRQCYAELRQGGIIVVMDKLGDENRTFLENETESYPHSGKITITGKDPTDGKKYTSASFSYSLSLTFPKSSAKLIPPA